MNEDASLVERLETGIAATVREIDELRAENTRLRTQAPNAEIAQLRAQNTALGVAINDLTARFEEHLSTPPSFLRRLADFLRVLVRTLVDPWIILNVIAWGFAIFAVIYLVNMFIQS